jgi:hypothetical protein
MDGETAVVPAGVDQAAGDPVEGSRPERAAHDDHGEAVGWQPELVTGPGPVAVAIDGEDLGPQRHAGHDLAGQRRRLEGHRAGGGQAGGQPARLARHHVVADHEHRDALDLGRHHRRHTGVAADGDDDRRLDAAEQPVGPADAGGQVVEGGQVGGRQRPGDAAHVEQAHRVAGGRHHRGLHAPAGADEVDALLRVPGVDDGLGHGEAGHHVACRAAAGDDEQRPAGGVAQWPHRAVRATFSSKPPAAIMTSSDDPPNETNGNVRPVSGIMPTTPPMLMRACVNTHAVTPPASSMPKRSLARNATCTPRRPEGDEQPAHREHADEAELLGEDGEDEVGVGLGQEAPLELAGAKADAGDAARGDADQRLPHLEPGVLLVLREIEEGQPPLTPVVGAHDEHHGGGRCEAGRRGQRDQGVPAMNATPSTMDAITSAPPRSGCIISSTPEAPSTTSVG